MFWYSSPVSLQISYYRLVYRLSSFCIEVTYFYYLSITMQKTDTESVILLSEIFSFFPLSLLLLIHSFYLQIEFDSAVYKIWIEESKTLQLNKGYLLVITLTKYISNWIMIIRKKSMVLLKIYIHSLWNMLLVCYIFW